MVCYGIFWSGQLLVSDTAISLKVHATIPKGIVGGFEAGTRMGTSQIEVPPSQFFVF